MKYHGRERTKKDSIFKRIWGYEEKGWVEKGGLGWGGEKKEDSVKFVQFLSC